MTLTKGAVGGVGAKRMALLEAIGAAGSISAASKAVGLSYRGAWDAVQALNNLFSQPLVVSHAGGAQGGSARLTAEGRSALAAFQVVQAELSHAFELIEKRLGNPPGGAIWSFGMKTSASNALRGVISAITSGAVEAQVTVDIGAGQEIVAVITRESVADLELAPGREVIALIKSSFVILARADPELQTSARNRLAGTVVRREDGAVNSEIVLELAPGRTLTAMVTRQSADELGLSVGAAAVALIKASHVILAVE
ncbi:MAG TPA: TOBE domain-containing protein [Caulobacteraceae bacterium]